ncbi:MAG TPA: hypothetical protein VFE37_20070 [Chloroflexota bacterium]|nr:hypothetical protein [Chloroflexota bacterium]
MSTWEYNLVHAPRGGAAPRAAGAPRPAPTELADALIREHAAAGWALHAVHHTRAGIHLLFRRPLPAGASG